MRTRIRVSSTLVPIVVVALLTPAGLAIIATPAGAQGAGTISTIAGDGTPAYNGDGIASASAQVSSPYGVTTDALGNVIFADGYNNLVRVIAKSATNPGYPLGGCGGVCTWVAGDIYTIAGTNNPGYNNDGIAATSAEIDHPNGVVVDSSGNVVFADYVNARIRVIAVSASNPGYSLAGCAGACTWSPGDIFTIAGNGTGAYGGDGGSATSASINSPQGIALDGHGNVVIADYGNEIIRVVALSALNPGYPLSGCGGVCTWVAGRIFTTAGTGTSGYNGDGISAVSAQLQTPPGVTVDSSDNILISDALNNRVRVVAVSASNPGYPLAGCTGACTWIHGDIFTIAGDGTGNSTGDGGIATVAEIDAPDGLTTDGLGNVVLTDQTGGRIRVVAQSAANPGYPLAGCTGACTWAVGRIFTVAGSGPLTYNGDNISATAATLNLPSDVTADPQGNLLISDLGNNRIRYVVATHFAIPATTTPTSASVTIGLNAAWSVPITNTSGAALHNVTATLHATANGTTPLDFDESSMPGCSAGAGNSEVCSIANVPAHTTHQLAVFAATTGLANGSTITGDATIAGAGQDTTGTLGTITAVQAKLSVPTATAPVAPQITTGERAAWTVPIANPSGVAFTGVTATFHATSGSSSLTFDDALMPGCSPAAGNAEVCSVGTIPPNTTENVDAFVLTTGLGNGRTITGTVSVLATGHAAVAGSLAPITIAACGTGCVIGVGKPGAPVASSTGPPTDAQPTTTSVSFAGKPDSPPVAITLKFITPGPTLSAADKQLCPDATPCRGQISVVSGNFTKYVDKAHPVRVVIIQKWKTAVPPGRILMAKDTGGPPIQLARCAKNGGRYNTPCAEPEVVAGSVATNNLTTTNAILFVGTDPRFARHVANGPDAPTAVKATAGKGRATVTWKAPVVTNGRITAYTVTPHIGRVAQKPVTFPGTALKGTITGLQKAKRYTFTVVAKTAAGVSLASKASNAVKPT